MTMAPSQDLRYEPTPFYHSRMERAHLERLVGASPMLAILLVGVLGLFILPPGDIRAIFGASVVIGGFLTTMFLQWLVSWFDRREARRCDAFLARAKAHGGWWFLHHHDARPTIVYADELRPLGMDKVPRLLEPLDLLGCDEHREIIHAEICRLHRLADGSRQVATQYLRHAEALEGLLQPDIA